MGGNGGKCGEMGDNGGQMGGNGVLWGEVGQITKILGLGWTGLISPFSPIFLHLSSGAFTNATPPPPKPCCQSEPRGGDYNRS